MRKAAWQRRKNQEAIKMLEHMLEGIKKGRLVVKTCGFWNSNLDSVIFWRFDTYQVDSKPKYGRIP